MKLLIKTTEDGRKVEVIEGVLCLDGRPEAQDLVPVGEHPNRQAILRAVPGATHVGGRLPLSASEAFAAQRAIDEVKNRFDASPGAIQARLTQALRVRALSEGVE